MNKTHKLFFYTAFFFLSVFSLSSSFAQEQLGLRGRADRLFQGYQYANAVPIYLKLVDTQKPRLSDMERLAESYQKMSNYGDAENWYARVIQDPKSNPENLIHYAEVLKQNAKYSDAKKALQAYADKTGKGQAVAHEIAGCDSALIWMANPTLHKLENETAVNTINSEFSAFPINGQVYFAGEPNLSVSDKRYGWTGNSYLRVYTADSQGSNKLSNPSISGLPFNEENYHVGPVSSDASGNTLFVTRTYPGKHAEVEKENKVKYRTHKLELYIYTKEGNDWKATPFAYNNVKEYSVGHASISPDGKTLYFASDMPGGVGGTDIWFSEQQADGAWGVPRNAGTSINTEKDELFPNIAADGNLYYSSNGLPGMGGLDIFNSVGSKSSWSKPANVKYPLNSAGDDFAFISNELTEDNVKGYLSSNRQGGKGDDDIYSFSFEKQKAKIILLLKGTTYNKDTKEALAEASVTLFSEGRKIVAKKNSAQDGSFLFELEKESDYKILAQKAGFAADSATVSTKGIMKSDTLYASLYLDPILVVGKTFQLENIHYDFDKDNIRKDAADILDRLLDILRENPTLKIELASHTDSRGSDSYNLDLSQRRAQSAVNYLVSRGINRDRMVAKGYGETRLLNRCANGVECSVAEHQANRRTEFTVLEF